MSDTEETPIPANSVEEFVEAAGDEIPQIYEPGTLDQSNSGIISEDKRREILGRLAEFEMLLVARTPMQQAFILSVLKNPEKSQKEHAILAGYEETSAKVRGSQLMHDSNILACIAAGQLLREDRTMITSERTLNELAIIAFSDITNFRVVPDGTGSRVEVAEGVPQYATRAIQAMEFKTTVSEKGEEVTTTYNAKIKLWSKTDALRMLALYQRLINGTGAGEGGITINDNRGQVHQHNTWQVGDKKITF